MSRSCKLKRGMGRPTARNRLVPDASLTSRRELTARGGVDWPPGARDPQLRSKAVEQAFGGVLDEVEHELEAARTAVVRVRNLVPRRAAREFHQHAELVAAARRREARQDLEVLAIERDDQIEAVEIVARNSSRAHGGEVVPPCGCGSSAALVRRLAVVIAVRACGVRFDQVGETCVRYELPEYARRGRRPADVAGADEQHALHAAAFGGSSSSSATPNTLRLRSASWSRTFAACSNSRLRAWSSICFSSRLTSRPISFSVIAS